MRERLIELEQTTRFIKIIKNMDEKEQSGLLLMLEGLKIMADKSGRKTAIHRREPHGQTFQEIP